ncbi:MAG: Tetracycline resistance protein, class B [Rhodospirillaceae bacterium]|nr:MAG: Tetracycline resistance protein, class B [Rhodospirillaceae bacterium]
MFALLLITFVNFVGIGALIPILPYTVIENLGYSETVMTALLASFALAMFIANPILGRLSDKVGRQPVLLISLIIGTAAHLWFALSNDILSMFAARIIAGLSAGNIGVIQAIIADNSKPEARARIMGFLGAAIGSGFVLGPAIGGLLGGLGDGPVHQVPFLVAALFSFIAVCLAMRLKLQSVQSAIDSTIDSTTDSGRQGFFQLLKSMLSSPIGLFALAFFCLNLAFAQVEASYVLLVRDLLDFGPRQTGWLFTYIGVCIIIVQGGLIGKLTNAFGEMRVVVAGVTVLAAGQLVTTIIAGGASPFGNSLFLAILVSTSFVCVGFALTNPTLSAASSYAAHSGQMGGALGLVQGFGSMGQVIGLSIAGPLYQVGTGRLSFGFGFVVTCLLLVVVWQIKSRQPNSATK